MYTIAIDDPKIYQAGEIFAKENHSSLKELVNIYVASLAKKVFSKTEKKEALVKTEEFKDAMAFMDSFVVDDLKTSVPISDNGKGALVHVKYSV